MNFKNFKNFASFKLSCLLLIILIAIFMRFYQLGNIPPSPDWDEAALGYNAYSIMLTGRDEYGKLLPVVLQSFGDYKPALYSYLAIPFVFIFGLTTFAVRFPSALFGVLSVILTYLLVIEIFRGRKIANPLALAASFFLAISPWSIQFSRVAFEANIGVTLNILTVLFFLKGITKPWMLSLSAFFAGLSIYAYQSEKVFMPLLIVILVLIHFKQVFNISRKYLVIAAGVGLLTILPMVLFILTTPGALERAKGTNIFLTQTQVLKDAAKKLERDRQSGNILGQVLDNRRVTYATTVVDGYLSHFDPNWLFITGDIARHHAPGMGLLYLFELPLLLIGIYALVFGDFNRKSKLLIFLWILAAPIPASITNDVPHAVRTLNFLPTFQIIIAIGLVTAYLKVSSFKHGVTSKNIGKLFAICYLLFAIFNFSYYFNQYFSHLNYYTASEWQYGYQNAVKDVEQMGDGVERIIVSDSRPLDNSYIFFLFYSKFSPSEYQKNPSHNFAKYDFRQLNWSQDSKLNNTIIVAGPGDDTADAVPVKSIYNMDGTTAIKIFKLK